MSDVHPLNRYNFDDWVFLVKANIYSSVIAVLVGWKMKNCEEVTREDMQRFREEADCIAGMWADLVLDESTAKYQLSRKEAEKNAARSCFNCGATGCEYGHCHPWDVGNSCFKPRAPKGETP